MYHALTLNPGFTWHSFSTDMLLAEVEKLVDQFGDAASAAASALLSAVQARSELLW